MAAKKNNKARAAGGPSKTEFVLGLPRELSAKDVVVKAKEKGLKLSEAYVYKIRSASKVALPRVALPRVALPRVALPGAERPSAARPSVLHPRQPSAKRSRLRPHPPRPV